MKRPMLSGLVDWIDRGLVVRIDDRRRKDGEVRRSRKLGTTEMLWLMLSVALNTGRSSLHEILRLTAAEMGMQWTISVAGFCKARLFFRCGTCTSSMASWSRSCSPGAATTPAYGRGTRSRPSTRRR